MTELVELLRTIAREMAEDDQPPSWHIPIVSAADEIVALRAAVDDLEQEMRHLENLVQAAMDDGWSGGYSG